MRVDVHTHIAPPAMVQDRSQFFDGEPIFQWLYESPKARLVTAESLLEAMDRDEIHRSVVFGFPWHNIETAKRHNDYVLEAASRHPSRLIPMGCVNPLSKDADREAQRCLQAGARGLGELAVYENCPIDAAIADYQALIDCCRSSGGVMLVHANEPIGHAYPGKAPFGVEFYYEIARRAEGMPLILAHWGGGLGFYGLLKKEVPEVLAHVYFDTAASPYVYRQDIYAAMVRIVGPDKILFGSDYPLLAPARYLREIESADLGAEVVQAIVGGNASRLFGVAM
ncbi:MAG TPA: amidohydrolase [Syntrophobacteraceae bacterium]|nr:amidohydrolase [Syntrophobacteraceae bacterium]